MIPIIRGRSGTVLNDHRQEWLPVVQLLSHLSPPLYKCFYLSINKVCLLQTGADAVEKNTMGKGKSLFNSHLTSVLV